MWSHKKEEEGKGAHKSPCGSEEAEGRGWARSRGLGGLGAEKQNLVLKLEDIYHPQEQKDTRRGARMGFGGQPCSISLAPRSSSRKTKQGRCRTFRLQGQGLTRKG